MSHEKEDLKNQNNQKESGHEHNLGELPYRGEKLPRRILDHLFSNGKKPDGENFASIFASSLNIHDDGIKPVKDEKGNFILEDRDGNTLIISPDEIKSNTGLHLSAEGSPVHLEKMTLGKETEVVVHRIAKHIDPLGEDIHDDAALPTVSAVKKYTALHSGGKSGSHGDGQSAPAENYPGVTSPHKGELRLHNNEEKTLEILPDKIISDAPQGLHISNRHGVTLGAKEAPVHLEKMTLGHGEKNMVDRIAKHIDPLGEDTHDHVTLPTVSALKKYTALHAGDKSGTAENYPGVTSPHKGELRLHNDKEKTLEILPDKIISDAPQGLHISNRHGVTLGAEEAPVHLDKMTLGHGEKKIEVHHISNNLSENRSNHALATAEAIVAYVDAHAGSASPVASPMLLPGFNCIVTDDKIFKELHVPGIHVCSTIGEALNKSERPAIFVFSHSGLWKEQFRVAKDARIVFAPDTVLTLPEHPKEDQLIHIQGKSFEEPISVEIEGNIDGKPGLDTSPLVFHKNETLENYLKKIHNFSKENTTCRGVLARHANLNFTGHIKNCHIQEGDGGGVHLDHCPEVKIIGDISGCTAPHAGGGAFITGDSATYTLNGNISRCSAPNGGGVCVQDKAQYNMTGNISECNADTNGGGMHITGSATGKITGNIENCNANHDGGGAFFKGDSTRFTLDGNINRCSAPNGGGVCVQDKAQYNMTGNISDCTTEGNGGGVHITGDSSRFTLAGDINGCKATNNESSGGGLYIDSGECHTTGNITGCTASHAGGGIYIYNEGTGSITGAMTGNINECNAGYGAGIFIKNAGSGSANGDMTGNITGCKAGQEGGGVYIKNSGSGQNSAATYNMTGNITGCEAGSHGGGVGVQEKGECNIDGDIIKCNAKKDGGGIFINESGHGSITGNISKCSANFGGGTFVSGGNYTMNGNIVRCSTVNRGAGLHIKSGESNITGSIIKCTAQGHGGGISTENSATINLTGNIIECASIKGNGGGVYIIGQSTRYTHGGNIIKCKATHKEGNGKGGGIFVEEAHCYATGNLISCSAVKGGTIYADKPGAKVYYNGIIIEPRGKRITKLQDGYMHQGPGSKIIIS